MTDWHMTDWQTNGVRVIPGDSLDSNTPQTPGMSRAAAINFALSVIWPQARPAGRRESLVQLGFDIFQLAFVLGLTGGLENPFVIVLLAPVAVAAATIAAAWTTFRLSERQGIASQRRESAHKLDLVASAAEAMVKRLEHVPPTIQLNPEVQRLLHDPTSARRVGSVNEYLRHLNAYLGSLSVYVMNDRGIVLASSNSDHPDDGVVGGGPSPAAGGPAGAGRRTAVRGQRGGRERHPQGARLLEIDD